MDSADTANTTNISRVYPAKIYQKSSPANIIKRFISLQARTQQIPVSAFEKATQALSTLLRSLPVLEARCKCKEIVIAVRIAFLSLMKFWNATDPSNTNKHVCLGAFTTQMQPTIAKQDCDGNTAACCSNVESRPSEAKNFFFFLNQLPWQMGAALFG